MGFPCAQVSGGEGHRAAQGVAEGEGAVGTLVTEGVAAASGTLAPLCVGVRSERRLECAQARTERRGAGGQTQVCLPPKGKT